MFAAVRDRLPAGDRRVWDLVSVDSTSVKAHQHAAGARFTGAQVLTGGTIERQGSARRAR